MELWVNISKLDFTVQFVSGQEQEEIIQLTGMKNSKVKSRIKSLKFCFCFVSCKVTMIIQE